MKRQYTWRGIRHPPIEDRRLSLRPVRPVNTKPVLEEMTKISIALLSVIQSIDRTDISLHRKIRQNITISLKQMKMCEEKCEIMLSSERFANLLRPLQNPFKCNCDKRFCKTFLEAIVLKEDQFHQAVNRIVKMYQLSNAEIRDYEDQSKMLLDLVECIVKKCNINAEQEKKKLEDSHKNVNIKNKNKIEEFQIQMEDCEKMRSNLKIEFEKREKEKYDYFQKEKQQIENKLHISEKEVDNLLEEQKTLKRELDCLKTQFKEKNSEFEKLESHYRKLKLEKRDLEQQNYSLQKQIVRGPIVDDLNQSDNCTTSTNKDRNASCNNRKKQEIGIVTENLYSQPSSNNPGIHVNCTNLNLHHIFPDQSNESQKSSLRISSRDTRRESKYSLHSHDIQSLSIQSQESNVTSHSEKQRLPLSSGSREATVLSYANPDTDDDDD